jgi:predicted O-methyltransferase YrrM
MMDNRIKKAAVNFMLNLTGASAGELREYVAEIRQDREFNESIEEKRSAHGSRRGSWRDYGLSQTLGASLYAVCRRQRPDIIVETGVASGVSSSHILVALEKNQHGQLYSIDMPSGRESRSGWIIPDYLRHRWHLTPGRSAETLGPLLKKVAEIDVFLHDSDHTYQNMMWEFEMAWAHLKDGGLLLAHNIDYNDVFTDFCREHNVKGYTLDDMGGMRKEG